MSQPPEGQSFYQWLDARFNSVWAELQRVWTAISQGDWTTFQNSRNYSDSVASQLRFENQQADQLQDQNNAGQRQNIINWAATQFTNLTSVLNINVQNIHQRISAEVTNLQNQSNQADQNIFQELNAQITAVNQDLSGRLNNAIANLKADILGVSDGVGHILGGIGKFVEDPLGWMLRFFQFVLIPWLSDHVADVIAEDTDTLGPYNDYVALWEDADLS